MSAPFALPDAVATRAGDVAVVILDADGDRVLVTDGLVLEWHRIEQVVLVAGADVDAALAAARLAMTGAEQP